MTFIAHLNYLPLLIIAGVVVADLILRYFIFGRLESVAIDVALFSTIYCAVELIRAFKEESPNQDEPRFWFIKFVATLIITMCLGSIHRSSESELKKVVEDIIADTKNKTNSARVKQQIDVSKPLVMRSILVSFTPPESMLRLGKRNWRAEAAHLMNSLADLKDEEQVQQEELTLPRHRRYFGLIVFGALGTLCVFIVGMPH